MTIDRYTKTVLTVIALALVVIALNGSGFMKPASAELYESDLFVINNELQRIARILQEDIFASIYQIEKNTR